MLLHVVGDVGDVGAACVASLLLVLPSGQTASRAAEEASEH